MYAGKGAGCKGTFRSAILHTRLCEIGGRSDAASSRCRCCSLWWPGDAEKTTRSNKKVSFSLLSIIISQSKHTAAWNYDFVWHQSVRPVTTSIVSKTRTGRPQLSRANGLTTFYCCSFNCLTPSAQVVYVYAAYDFVKRITVASVSG